MHIRERQGSTSLMRPARLVQGQIISRLDVPFDHPAGAVIEGDFYILPGDSRVARGEIYELRHVATADFTDPQGYFDVPAEAEHVSGTIDVAGWAWANDDSHGGYVASAEVFVDGKSVGLADLHIPRPDVAQAVPGTPADAGYVLQLDTTAYANGPHRVRVVVTDFGGNSIGNTHQVTFAN